MILECTEYFTARKKNRKLGVPPHILENIGSAINEVKFKDYKILYWQLFLSYYFILQLSKYYGYSRPNNSKNIQNKQY